MVRMPLWVERCVAFWYSQNYSSIHEHFFIFQPQFTFNTISHQFQIYSEVARKPFTLQVGAAPAPSTHLAPYSVISTLLTVFSMLQNASLWFFCNYQFVLLNPLTFLTQPPKSPLL